MRVAGILLAIFVVFATAKKNYEGYKVYRVTPATQLHLNLLHVFEKTPNFDFWSKVPAQINHHVDVMVTPQAQIDFENFLRRAAMNYIVLINNVEKIVLEERSRQSKSKIVPNGKISFTKYNSYDEIQSYLAQVASDYPNIAQVGSIGESYEGRQLSVLRLSNGNSPPGDKPAIFIDGGIHAREWIAPAQVLYIITQVLENQSMLDDVDWWFLPLFNPDGYEYTHSDDRFWRKTRSPGDFCDGVDGNRNFDFHWMETGASDYECSETYAGPKPLSEKETTAVADFLKEHSEIKLYLTFHSYGEYILYPWGYTSSLPSDADELDSLGQAVRKAIRAVAGTDYTVGSSTNVLYAAAGGSDDYAKGVAGIQLSYTIELPGGGMMGFDLPASEIMAVCTETYEGVKVYHEHIVNKFSK